MSHVGLQREGELQGFPWQILRTCVASYRIGRVLRVGAAHSQVTRAGRTIIAGCVHATALIKCYMRRTLSRVCTRYPLLDVREVVDDVSLQRVGKDNDSVAQDIVGAAALIGEDFKELGLTLQVKKSAVVTRDPVMAERLDRDLKRMGYKRHLAVRLRGNDFSGAGRRSVAVRQARIRKAEQAGPRLTALRRAGGNAMAIFSRGTVKGALWSSAVDGVSNVQLAQIRHVAGLATRAQTAGKSLTLDLALSEGRSPDPFVQVCAEPVFEWCAALWEDRVPALRLRVAFVQAVADLAGKASPWMHVKGPAGVLVLTLARLGWSAQAYNVFVTQDGTRLELGRWSPAFVRQLAVADAKVALLRKLDLFDDRTSVPALGPLSRVVRLQPGRSWSKAEGGAVRSLVVGTQWPQQRLAAAGFAPDSACALCGQAAGTLLHRAWCCEATLGWRQQRAPDLLRALPNKEGVSELSLERAIARSVDHLLPKPVDSLDFVTEVDGVISGVVYLDGSAEVPGDPVRRRVGYGIARLGAGNALDGGWYGAVPGPQTCACGGDVRPAVRAACVRASSCLLLGQQLRRQVLPSWEAMGDEGR